MQARPMHMQVHRMHVHIPPMHMLSASDRRIYPGVFRPVTAAP